MHANSIARRWRLICVLTALVALLASAAASADPADPQYRLWAIAPDSITDGKPVQIHSWFENTGLVPLSGTVTVTNTFPAGIVPSTPDVVGGSGFSCQIVNQDSICDVDVDGLVPGSQVRLTYGDRFSGTPFPIVQGATGTVLDTVTASGGGMASAQIVQQAMTVGASEPFAVRQFAMDMPGLDGAPDGQAGSTPSELANTLQFRMVATDPFGIGIQSYNAPPEHFRNVVVHVPPGFVGNPGATSERCTLGQLDSASPQSPSERTPACPENSQIGFARVYNPGGPDMVQVFNLVPPAGSPAAFGFNYLSLTAVLTAKLRPNDNGIDLIARTTPTTIPIPAVYVTLWGVPADSSHDYLRYLCMDGVYMGNFGGRVCPSDAETGAFLPPRPFLRTPTSCSDGPLPWSVEADSHEHPDTFVSGSTTTAQITGCGLLPFDPVLTLVPSTSAAHSPAGVDATVAMPQDVAPGGLWEADLRSTTVTLPDGMGVNASSLDGLRGCADADLRLGQDGASTCPDGSKIGTVTLTTPLLDHPLSGSVWLRTQNSDDPESGDLYRLAVEVRSDDDGVDIKLPAAVRANRATGQLTTTFDNTPQLPFSALTLHFKTGPRAPLTTPRTCGTQNVLSHMVGWNNKSASAVPTFGIGGCGPVHLTPTFRAGSDDPRPVTRTPFQLSLKRDDADELFKGLTVKTPEGLLGYIKSAQQCPEAAANAGTCSSGSLIGRAVAGAGVGSNPFFFTDGKVFLTGPYNGGRYGLSVVVPAAAGPFNLGNVVVRAAIHIDRHTSQLTVVSDPFPTIVKGAPVNLRSVRIDIDRRGFMVTPSSCERKSVDATVTSTTGLSARVSSPYRLAGCRGLAYDPRLKLSVGSRHHTGFGVSTPFTAKLTQAPGQSNIARVKVTLPNNLAALLAVVERACTQAQFDTGRCEDSRAGTAVARTPLLAHPLRGGAYFVKHPGQPLPDLVVGLRGEVSIDLVGTVTIPGGKLLATDFKMVPDAPISSFSLHLVSGRHGPLGVSKNLCTRRSRRATATVLMRSQSGVTIVRHQRLHINGCSARRHR